VDGLCLGEVGMESCGDSNLWGVRGAKGRCVTCDAMGWPHATGAVPDGLWFFCYGSYTLELVANRQLGPQWSESKPERCLDRRRCFWPHSKVSADATPAYRTRPPPHRNAA
jgi:hypothetical protein